VPRAAAARMVDVARALIGKRPVETRITGIRPGEKIHEIMVSDEEAARTVDRGKWYAILPMLPELQADETSDGCLHGEFSSAAKVMNLEETHALLQRNRLLVDDGQAELIPEFAQVHEVLR
jgi:FlaA1/EpsC-like NDP-sugar epimerase